ncbi:hypothetical protein Tco_0602414 [Tanacetum coccineum]
MEQMTTLRDLVDQVIKKKEEEKRIAEEQAAKDRSWKIPICYHLDTIPETELDEFIKSSVEDLVQIPSESKGIPDKMCDVPLCNNTTSLNALNEHSEIVVNSNDDNSSSDDDSTYGEDIEYVEASPPDVEIISSGSPTTHSELSLPDYKAFYIDNDHFKERNSGSTTTHVDFSQYDSFIFDLSNDQFPPKIGVT